MGDFGNVRFSAALTERQVVCLAAFSVTDPEGLLLSQKTSSDSSSLLIQLRFPRGEIEDKMTHGLVSGG